MLERKHEEKSVGMDLYYREEEYRKHSETKLLDYA